MSSWVKIFLILTYFSYFSFASNAAAAAHGAKQERQAGQLLKSNTTSSENTTTSTMKPPTTPATTTTTEETIDNPNVFGCTYPKNYREHFRFCLDKSKIPVDNSSNVLEFGIFDGKILKAALEECQKSEKTCGESISNLEFKEFIEFWKQHNAHLVDFKKCLEENTAGLIKLCGADSKVGKAISGIGGLHLNVINVLTTLANEASLFANGASALVADCSLKLVKSVYHTTLFHLYKKHYMENVVLCWDMVSKGCPGQCGKLAQELDCLLNSCQNITARQMQAFGIWQWFYNDQANALKACNVPKESCTGSGLTGAPKDLKAYVKSVTGAVTSKLFEVKKALETYFHQPINVIGGAFAAGLFAFCVVIGIACFWVQGGMCKRKTRPIKYSVLLNGDKTAADESRSLTRSDPEFEDVE